MQEYNFEKIEKNWINYFEKNDIFKQNPTKNDAKKYYVLEMFPYPSGKIHMGHVRNYTIGDVIARYKKMKGFNVLHPIGWDSFGLPAENAAVKNGVHPYKWTMENIQNMRKQLKLLGFSYDWDNEMATCSEEYYKWNQWLFIKMYEKGLVYKKTANVNWCTDCDTVLANEQVEDGNCWRCGNPVIQKDLDQWFIKITDYANELLADLNLLKDGWPEKVLTMQKNWIGKSSGTQIDFKFENSDEIISVFTTRPDTVFGVTYLVIAPESKLAESFAKENCKINDVITKMKNEDKFSRTSESSEKTGIFTGIYLINPLTNEKVELWIGNYVLMDYGTGAVMAVPAHDHRDFLFAKKYNLKIKIVIQNNDNSLTLENLEDAYTKDGILVDSKQFSGLKNRNAISKITKFLKENNLGKSTINFRIRDWLISRQRYWGTPIPMIYCKDCGIIPENESKLPVSLPIDIKFLGTGNPLESSDSFQNVNCPKCGKHARRETDTMDTFFDSSWYFLRYISPKLDSKIFDSKTVNHWMGVDQYIGGVEHAVMHLLYARFFTKIFRDLGLVNIDEPFKNLLTQGMVLANSYYCKNDNKFFNINEITKEKKCSICGNELITKMEKMSKSKNNGIDPEHIIKKYGADSARLFTLFAAPPEKELEWNENGLAGAYRFLNKIWLFVSNIENTKNIDTINIENLSKTGSLLFSNLHKTIKKVTLSIENNFHFNTSIAAIMEFINLINSNSKNLKTLEDQKLISYIAKNILIILNPFTPFITCELWKNFNIKTDLYLMEWPKYSEKYTIDNIVKIGVQINGKLRGEIESTTDDTKETLEKKALNLEKIQKYCANKNIVKIIIIKNRIINIVVK